MDPLKLGPEWQLFLDDQIIEVATGFDRVLHPPTKRGPVLSPDQPWERSLSHTWINRGADGRLHAIYSMPWYEPAVREILHPSARDDKPHWFVREVAYAVSEDGLHWEKPRLGLVETPAALGTDPFLPEPLGATTENNCGVPFLLCYDLGTCGNVTDPSRRFLLQLRKNLGTLEERGPFNRDQGPLCFAPDFPDFVNDPSWCEKLTPIENGRPSPRGFLNIAGYDELHNEWFGLMQGVRGHWIPSRDMARWSTPDFVNWTARPSLFPSPEDPHTLERYDEFMEIDVSRHEGFWLGFMVVFHSDRSNPQYGIPGRWWRKGTTDLQLITSRDGGRTWNRVANRGVWLPHGTEEDSFDRMTYVGRPLRMGDETFFYYQCFDGDHLSYYHDETMSPYYHDRLRRGRIALATQRWNGYVSLTTGTLPETFVSKPFTFQGEHLFINADASRGEIKVELVPVAFGERVDPWAPETCSGLSFKESVPLTGKGIEQPVTWQGSGSLSSHQGQPVRLRIQVRNADLYGFRFGRCGRECRVGETEVRNG
jgi:hypothetical protein